MKRKTLILTLLVALGLVLFYGVGANAQEGTFACTVNAVGPNQSGIYVSLTDTWSPPAFEGSWFRFPDDRSNEMLAIALAAMANDMRVYVVADPGQTLSEIKTMYLLSE